jgi:uncharacterized protein (DUF4415 family)
MRQPKDKDIDFSDIPEWTAEDFKRARRVTPEEHARFRQAYINTFGKEPPARGRPAKAPHQKYRDIHLKLHPKALSWARAEAKRRGIGYQTIINEILLRHAA